MMNSMVENPTEAIEKARRIEDSICSVLSNLATTTNTTTTSISLPNNRNNEYVQGLISPTSTALRFASTSMSTINSAGGALPNEFSSPLLPSVISKHKSLASSLPSLSGVMINPSSLSPTSVSSLNAIICRSTAASTTTTTSTRSSRNLQMIGDLPENVLETSCTPPSSPSKSISGGGHQHHQQQPIFASLMPINVNMDGGGHSTTIHERPSIGLMSPTINDPHHQRPMYVGSNPNAAAAAALTQLFPMVTSSMNSLVSPTYLNVKVEAQDGGHHSTVMNASSMLSPLHFSLPNSGGDLVTSPTTTMTMTTQSSSNSEFVSLQPAALYVQPVEQNGQVQYVRLELPASLSLPSNINNGPNGGSNGNNGKQPSSTVSTVELAHSIIANMFPQPIGAMSTSAGNMQFDPGTTTIMDRPTRREHEEKMVGMTPTFILTDQSDPKMPPTMTAFKVTTTTTSELRPSNVSTSATTIVQQRFVPAGITVSTTNPPPLQQHLPLPPQLQIPASVASRKRVSSSSTSQQTRQRQQSLSLSKDAPSSTGNASGGEDGGEDDIYIDTKDLCNRIAYELKAHSIPQAVFAERVLCRSQGTLSDLLRNPKPWNKLKSGRETFRRMFAWLKQPLAERMTSLELWKGEQTTTKRKSISGEDPAGGEPGEVPASMVVTVVMEEPTPAAAAATETATAMAAGEASGNESVEEISSEDVCYREEEGGGDLDGGNTMISPRSTDDPIASTSSNQLAMVGDQQQLSPQRHQQRVNKKPRLVFTDIQKRTLQAIFKETQRPSREMQQTIAEHLNLDLSTVQNFFMNARRRSRIDQPEPSDSPTPFQQVHSITPPPPTASMVSPLSVSNIDPNIPQSIMINTVVTTTPTIAAMGRPTKPKRIRRGSKAKNDDDERSATSNDQQQQQPSSTRLPFSSGSSSPKPGLINLPTLTLRNDGQSVNGGDEGMVTSFMEGENDEEFIEEDEEIGQHEDEPPMDGGNGEQAVLLATIKPERL